MRDELDNEMHNTGRRDSRLRKLGVPILAAATVVALAAGGYALFGGGDRKLAPAGGPDTVSATPTTPTRNSPPPNPRSTKEKTEEKIASATPEKPGQSTPVTNAAQAYRTCIGLVRSAGAWDGGAIKGLAPKLAVDNGKGITVVVANTTDAYTCNVKPDSAVSHPRPLNSAVSPEAFAVANNVTSNVLDGDPGDMFWGGGALPEGVSSITYVFPDRHQEQAAVKDGFWAMQYFSGGPREGATSDPVKVKLNGSGGSRELTLRWGEHTCNQVSHGC